MNDAETPLAELRAHMANFVAERDWQRFHRPKNLASSIAIEAAELMEHFQWEDPDPADMSLEQREAAGEELADVFAYVLSLANALELDLAATYAKKMVKNQAKYPAGPRRHHSPGGES